LLHPPREQEVHQCLSIPLGIQVDMTLVRVVNEVQKPGPVFNEMARVAYDLGIDYFFRVNDDTEILQPWTTSFIRTLKVV
jgi:hypothetical protein